MVLEKQVKECVVELTKSLKKVVDKVMIRIGKSDAFLALYISVR